MEQIKAQDMKKMFIQETADWLNKQIEQVWCALGTENIKENDRNLQIKHKGKYIHYYFCYKEKFCAEARSYFNSEENKWMFELLDAAPEYYLMIRDYFTKKKT